MYEFFSYLCKALRTGLDKCYISSYNYYNYYYYYYYYYYKLEQNRNFSPALIPLSLSLKSCKIKWK